MRSVVSDRGPDIEFNTSAYSKADELYRASRFRDALRLFKASLEADPSDGEALFAMGSCYDALRKPARAAAAYRSAMELLPPDRHPALHFNVGNAFLDLGQYAEALEEYKMVPKGHAVWPAATRNANLALEKLGNGG